MSKLKAHWITTRSGNACHCYLKSEADKGNFDVFTLTLDVDGDESNIEVIKETK